MEAVLNLAELQVSNFYRHFKHQLQNKSYELAFGFQTVNK
jgi:hypothetical protein